MARITVFTPSYNRAHLLPRSYAAMKRQSSKDFVWLIVDDGSVDNTKALVEGWQREENDFSVEYVYKENGGLQSGYVEALKHIKTELCFCVDSDDYLTDDAIESVIAFWDANKTDGVAGILALDMFENGEVLGGLEPPGHPKQINLIDLHFKKYPRAHADFMLIIRTDIYKTAKPAKRYPGEITMNATYLHLQISKNYDFLIFNRPICVVEYQSDGMTKNRVKNYVLSPNAFADWRLFMLGLKKGMPFRDKVRHNIHYVAECMVAGHRRIFRDSPTKLLCLLCFPAGAAFALFINLKMKK